MRIYTLVSLTSAMSLLASAAPAQTPAPAIAPAPPKEILPRERLDDLKELDWIDTDLPRNLAASAARIAQDDAWMLRGKIAPMAATLAVPVPDLDFDFDYAPRAFAGLAESPRASWAADDPADSLYRLARQTLNSGDYRRAAQLFAQITRQYPTSQYRADAAYWRAFALYRIGGIADLHEALQALDSAGTRSATAPERARVRAKEMKMTIATPAAEDGESRAMTLYLNARSSSDREAAVLATRIRGALAARGDATAAAQIARTADSSAISCDDEDAQLRVEALNALVQMDPKNADPAIAKVLARRDTCSAPLRRGALGLIARSNDAHNTDLLIGTAKSDPSLEVRAEAIRLLGRAPDDRATAALVGFATATTDKAPLQRIAVRSLAAQQSPASTQALRSLMTRTDVSNDVRITALHYAGKKDLQLSDLIKMYDASADRSTREEIISLLDQRPEPQAADKLIDIARTSTDPSMRRQAISALSRKKDPRVTKLLLDIIDK